MARIVTEPCIGKKHGDCAEVCPTECFYDLGDMLVINPDDCIDCAACEDACPEAAILPDDEADEKWIKINEEADFDSLKQIFDKDDIER